MKRKTPIEWLAITCIVILIFFFLSIVTRFITNQFCEKELIGEDEETTTDIINWEVEYPFKDNGDIKVNSEKKENCMSKIDKYLEIVDIIKSKVTAYTNELLIGRLKIVTAAELYNSIIGSPDISIDSNVAEVVHLNNGYLAYTRKLIEKKEIQEIADSVFDFYSILREKEIPFVYMNAGSKVCPYDKQLPEGVEENSNENSDNLLEALRRYKIETVDFREYIQKDNIDWYQYYYITDPHWKTTTGLWAADIIAKYLNQKCGFDFNDIYFDKRSYSIDIFEDYFLGAQGREITLVNAELESYERILPKFETDFSLKIPMRSIDLKGTYQETLFNEEIFSNIANYTNEDFISKPDAYHSVTIQNDDLAEIINLSPPDNKDKKILMLQDSFSWYSTTFLACDVAEIDIICPKSFDGSIQAYIEKTKPDVVVMMVYEVNIEPIEWETHKSTFDLR